MKYKFFIHNIVFRIVAAPLYGTLVYILILLIFDSLEQLSDNFFSQEVLLNIVLTFLVLESNRLVIIILDKILPVDKSLNFRIIIQFILNSILSLTIVSLIISLYFYYIIGFSSFRTELITFNIIFLISSILYNMLYFSIIFLYEQNKVVLQKENTERENIEYQLQSFINQVIPEFLYRSLETLISLMKQNTKSADDLIDNLSKVYRYTLDNKHAELVSIKTELENSNNLLFVLNSNFANNIIFNKNVGNNYLSFGIIPCTVQYFIRKAVFQNIVSINQSLTIDCEIIGEFLQLNYVKSERLIGQKEKENLLQNIQKAYSYYTENQMDIYENEKGCTIKIPLLKMD
ncbi:MAG: histidine kinase [Bacteroidetes bacterium]|nr:histidine kinase [Bacteroidota bacterium]MBT6685408.1 histidine kinase [Bacteroidota bacterium]MBT7143761.1 histidine kinase [Bacteroidota bacterium]MBT7493099.1 histidine kinase [Bacteroidota bacterium]